jgi:hypothetical protein
MPFTGIISELYHNIKFLLLLCVIAVIFQVNPLGAEDNSGDESIYNPEGTSWLYAYGGYGYYRWKMMSMDGFIDMFTSDIPSTGMRFKHESTPYVVKKYGVKTNLPLLSLGLDYFSDKFSLPFESESEKELEEEEDNKRARQLKYLSGLTFGNLSFQFNVTLREFDSTITSQGYKPSMNPGVFPIYYYPESGSMIPLAVGDKAAWYTKYRDYEGKMSYNYNGTVMDFGARYVKYNAPTELTISKMGSTGDVLMFTENTTVSLFMGAGRLSHLAGDFYMRFYIPVNLSGYYYAESDYFGVKNKKPFSADTLSLTTSSAGNFSLAYILRHFKLEGGVDYGMYYSMLMLSKAELKKDVQYLNSMDGTTETALTGEQLRIEADRMEFFWGFYLHASAYF